MKYIKEFKQVGVLYHFTTSIGAMFILDNEEFSSKKHGEYRGYISFTRYYDIKKIWKSFSDMEKKSFIRISVDGNRLSNNFKIETFQHKDFSEGEERVFSNKIPIDNVILRVDIHYRAPGSFKSDIINKCHEKNIPVYIVTEFMPYHRQQGENV